METELPAGVQTDEDCVPVRFQARRHGTGHAGTLVRGHRDPRALEARVQRSRGCRDVSSASVEAAGQPRYVVGIDLGTTNSAATYVDTWESARRVRTLLLPQIVAPGVFEARDAPCSTMNRRPASSPTARFNCPRRAGGRRGGPLRPRPRAGSGAARRFPPSRGLCHSGVDRMGAAPALARAARRDKARRSRSAAATWNTSARPGTPTFPTLRWPNKTLF